MGYRVKVNGIEERVYFMELGYFIQYEGVYPAAVEIWCDQVIERVDIRPKSRSVSAEHGEGKIVFSLSTPMKLSIEVNEDLANPLFLFADPPEGCKPDPEDPRVKYYKGGHTYDAGEIELANNETLYIERGAVVNGCVIAQGVQDIRIVGRGILDASGHQNATQILGCDNVEISGVIVVKGGIEWVNRIFCCTNVHIHNYKGISWGRYSDGIDLLGCKHVLVEDVFVRSEDDSICIKSNKFGYSGDVEDIRVRDSVIWNGLSGNAIDIGYETDTDHIRDIVFQNLDIIRTDKPKESWWRRSALSIHHAGKSAISGIRFEEIRIEAAMESLIYFELVTTTPEWGSGGGTLADIYMKDVRLVGGPATPSIIRGLEGSVIKGVTFENFVYHGKPVKDEQGAVEAGFSIEFAEVLWK